MWTAAHDHVPSGKGESIMGLFALFGRKKESGEKTDDKVVYSPVKGEVIRLEDVEDEAFASECNAEYVDLDTLISESDFITIHSPLTPETQNLIGKEQLRMMKKEVILINTARGGIIDEDALYEALKSGEIRAAALDATVDEEPSKSKLNELQNCILTPHAGAATREASSKMSLMAARNVLEVLETGESRNQITI